MLYLETGKAVDPEMCADVSKFQRVKDKCKSLIYEQNNWIVMALLMKAVETTARASSQHDVFNWTRAYVVR